MPGDADETQWCIKAPGREIPGPSDVKRPLRLSLGAPKARPADGLVFEVYSRVEIFIETTVLTIAQSVEKEARRVSLLCHVGTRGRTCTLFYLREDHHAATTADLSVTTVLLWIPHQWWLARTLAFSTYPARFPGFEARSRARCCCRVSASRCCSAQRVPTASLSSSMTRATTNGRATPVLTSFPSYAK